MEQQIGTLWTALNDEKNPRMLAGLLSVVVLLLHLWITAILLEPTTNEKPLEKAKVMEVALIVQKPPEEKKPEPPKPEPPKPKPKPPKPAPPKPTPVKKPPKKPEAPPVVKVKEPIVHKVGEIEKPKAVAKEAPYRPPVLVNPFAKPNAPPTKSTPSVAKPSAPARSAPAKPTNSGSSNASQGGNSGVVPLVRVQPTYPARAASRHIEGWVKVEFTVNASGGVTNPVVVGASPPGIFDEAALNAIRRWRFKQRIVNGSPVAQRAVQVLRFKLAR